MATGESIRESLTGKVVAVTGGARGIGHETVKLLAAGGAKIGVGDLDESLVERSLAGLPGETAAFGLDVGDRESFQAFVEGVEQRLGPIDVLINNAGVMSLSPFTDESDTVSERQLRVNVIGPMNGMKIVIPRMLGRGRGHVINVVSSAGRFGVPGAAMYSASKFGAFGLTEAVSTEYDRTPLQFSAICPVVVRTDLTLGVKLRTRLAPMLEPEDVARAIVQTIATPKAVVYVPGNVRFTYLLTLVMPAALRRALVRFTRSDRVLTEIDAAARRAYDDRAFGEPAARARKS